MPSIADEQKITLRNTKASYGSKQSNYTSSYDIEMISDSEEKRAYNYISVSKHYGYKLTGLNATRIVIGTVITIDLRSG